MSRLSRPLTLAMLAVSLTACETIPNLTAPGETLRGEVSGNFPSGNVMVAITEGYALDFSDATFVKVTNGKFNYTLPNDATIAFVAAFEDEDGNGKWDPGEPISSDPQACQGCSYLQLTKVDGSWKVTEQTATGPKSATLNDSSIAFNA